MEHILFIDDATALTELVPLVFPEYLFSTAHTGSDGLKLLEEDNSISLIFLDYDLPQMNGLDILSVIRERFPHLTVIMISGFPHITEESMRSGAFAFIDKPIDYDDLQDVIWLYLDQKESNDKL